MAGVIVSRGIHDTVVNGGAPGQSSSRTAIPTGPPARGRCCRGNLALYHEEKLFERARAIAPRFEQAVHSLKGAPHVIDVRNFGLMAGIDIEPIPGKPAARGYAVFLKCLEKGVLARGTGDTIALSPPLIVTEAQIDEIVGTIGAVLREPRRPKSGVREQGSGIKRVNSRAPVPDPSPRLIVAGLDHRSRRGSGRSTPPSASPARSSA